MKSLMIVKPDGLSKLPFIFTTLQEHKIKLYACKSINFTTAQAKALYADLVNKPFYSAVVKYMESGTCLLLAIEGEALALQNAKRAIRDESRRTGNEAAFECLIECLQRLSSHDRDKYLSNSKLIEAYKEEYNATFDAVHCSDTENASKELSMFFIEEELNPRAIAKPVAAQIILEKMDSIAQAKSSAPAIPLPKLFNVS